MGYKSTEFYIPNDLANGGIQQVPYPHDLNNAVFATGPAHKVSDASGNLYTGISIIDNGSALYLINSTGRTLRAGERVILHLDDGWPLDSYENIPLEKLGMKPDASLSKNTDVWQRSAEYGGLRTLNRPGTYVIGDTGIVYPNSALYVGPLSKVKLTGGTSNKAVLQNGAFSSTADACTLSWSSGLTMNVTKTAGNHRLTTDDSVCIDHTSLADIDQSLFKGIWPVIAVVDANTVTVQLDRVPTTAPTTGFVMKKADDNISVVVDGAVDYNWRGGNSATGGNSNCTQFAFVRGLRTRIRGQDPGNWVQMVGFVRDFIFDVRTVGNIDAANNMEIAKTFGPAHHGVIRHVSGRSSDDGCSLQCRQPTTFTGTYPSFGDIIDVEMREVAVNMVGSTGAAICVMYPSKYEWMDDIRIGKIGGSTGAVSGAAAFRISGTDPVGSGFAGMSNGNFGSIAVGAISAAAEFGFIGKSARGKSLTIDQIDHNPTLDTSTAKGVFVDTDFEVQTANISVVSKRAGWPSATAYLAQIAGAIVNGRLKLVLGQDSPGANARLLALTAETAWAATTAYTVGAVRRGLATAQRGYRFECTTAGTSGGSEPSWNTTIGGTTSDGTVTWTTRVATKQLVLDQCYQQAGSQSVDIAASISAIPTVVVRGSDLKATTAIIGVAATALIEFEDNQLSPPSSGLVRVTSGSPAVTVRGDGKNKFASGTTPAMVNAGTSPTWDVQMPELQVPGTYATSSGALAAGTNAGTIKTTATVNYLIGGQFYSKAATDNLAVTAATLQAVSTTRIYLVQIDSAGTVSTVQGQAGGTIPAPSANNCPIGAFKITTDGVTTYTPGAAVALVTGGGLTVSYLNFSQIPQAMTF